jgi:hypothetical protein
MCLKVAVSMYIPSGGGAGGVSAGVAVLKSNTRWKKVKVGHAHACLSRLS